MPYFGSLSPPSSFNTNMFFHSITMNTVYATTHTVALSGSKKMFFLYVLTQSIVSLESIIQCYRKLYTANCVWAAQVIEYQ